MGNRPLRENGRGLLKSRAGKFLMMPPSVNKVAFGGFGGGQPRIEVWTFGPTGNVRRVKLTINKELGIKEEEPKI